jgi:hypothetical protein
MTHPTQQTPSVCGLRMHLETTLPDALTAGGASSLGPDSFLLLPFIAFRCYYTEDMPFCQVSSSVHIIFLLSASLITSKRYFPPLAGRTRLCARPSGMPDPRAASRRTDCAPAEQKTLSAFFKKISNEPLTSQQRYAILFYVVRYDTLWSVGSVGRAHRSHRWGHWFESSTDHQNPSQKRRIFLCRMQKCAETRRDRLVSAHFLHISHCISVILT